MWKLPIVLHAAYFFASAASLITVDTESINHRIDKITIEANHRLRELQELHSSIYALKYEPIVAIQTFVNNSEEGMEMIVHGAQAVVNNLRNDSVKMDCARYYDDYSHTKRDLDHEILESIRTAIKPVLDKVTMGIIVCKHVQEKLRNLKKQAPSCVGVSCISLNKKVSINLSDLMGGTDSAIASVEKLAKNLDVKVFLNKLRAYPAYVQQQKKFFQKTTICVENVLHHHS